MSELRVQNKCPASLKTLESREPEIYTLEFDSVLNVKRWPNYVNVHYDSPVVSYDRKHAYNKNHQSSNQPYMTAIICLWN